MEMEKGYYKTVQELVGHNEKDIEHKDKEGKLLYTEHIKEPVYENNQEWIEYTQDEILENLRYMRQNECFSVINRGALWYNLLTTEQQQELNIWYQAWLNVPQVYLETKPTDIETIIPTKPSWLK